MVEQLAQQSRIDDAGSPDLPIGVVTRRLGKELPNRSVDKHVAGTGVEGTHLLGPTSCGQEREVGDATDVEHGARLRIAAQQEVIDIRYEWSALASGRDVGDAEVRDRRQAGAFGDERRLSELQRGWDARGSARR